MKKAIYPILLFIVALFVSGFSLDNIIVPREEILSGGPPKDGIPAILDFKFIPVDKATYLEEDDQVVGVVIGNQARAYPIKILNWHEAVNDTVGNTPLVVSF